MESPKTGLVNELIYNIIFTLNIVIDKDTWYIVPPQKENVKGFCVIIYKIKKIYQKQETTESANHGFLAIKRLVMLWIKRKIKKD